MEETRVFVSDAMVSAFVISGSSRELARIVGGSIGRLADGPERKSGIPSHLHRDPTSDPDQQFYSPGSGSLTVGFEPTEV
jgi:hypothetical protein